MNDLPSETEKRSTPPELLELVRALAEMQAKADHDRELEASAVGRRDERAPAPISAGEMKDGEPDVRLQKVDMSKDPLLRVRKRPNVDQWRGDEPITLKEAVALFFPEGPLTISSFRSAIRRGELSWMKLAGKMFTTPDAVREMMRPELRTRE